MISYSDITDTYIKNTFFNKHGRLNGNHSTEKWLFEHEPNILKYLQERFVDSESLHETFLRIYYNIEQRPKCPYCGNVRVWWGKHNALFGKTCGNGKCYCEQRKNTLIAQYGEYINFGGTDESVKKIKQTKLKRYGNENYNNIDKIKQTCMERYNRPYSINHQHVKQICIERYGGIGGASPIIAERMRKTCLEKYGVDNYRKTQECVTKVLETRKKNHTMCTSACEEIYYTWLVKHFGETNVFRQYIDNRYRNPKNNHLYHCDFYIKSLDLFIEIQGYWGHGNHPYDITNEEDLKIIQYWQTKDKLCYKQAIETWTEKDVIKRNVAMQNNLNYIEIFEINLTEEEFIKKIKMYANI